MKALGILFLLLSFAPIFAQQSQLWEEYKKAKKTATEHKLPNFSFAGYKYSEHPIPSVKHKVFNVTDFGASPKGDISSKNAIRKAIAAAEENGSGIIFFPKGRYLINTEGDDFNTISISKSNIVLRGEGNGDNGSVLFFEKERLWF